VGHHGVQRPWHSCRTGTLEHLSLKKSHGNDSGIPTSCLDGITQLNRLTSLKLGGQWSGGQQPLQQFLAQPLPLRQLRLNLKMRLPKLELAHCSQLQDLTIHTPWNLPKGSTLPLQLQSLVVSSGMASGDQLAELQLQRLQQLQYLSLQVAMTARSLQDLTQLQALRHVALVYCTADDAEVSAEAWQQLPQLHELSITYGSGDTPDKDQMLAILRGIEGCRSLTELELEVRAVHVEEPEEDHFDPEVIEERVAACRSLSGLTNLQDLRFSASSQLTAGDALWLTALTGLAHLDLGGIGEGVGEMAATAIACSLRELRFLDLQDCALGDIIIIIKLPN
jgi:hypothetical protein